MNFKDISDGMRMTSTVTPQKETLVNRAQDAQPSSF
jgi:hypothetical protein